MTCNAGYYLNSGQCYACQANCASCISNTQCTTCNNGFYLQNNGRCKTLPSNCISIDNTTLSSTVGSCKRCKYGYILLDGNCYPCGLSLFNVNILIFSWNFVMIITVLTTMLNWPLNLNSMLPSLPCLCCCCCWLNDWLIIKIYSSFLFLCHDCPSVVLQLFLSLQLLLGFLFFLGLLLLLFIFLVWVFLFLRTWILPLSFLLLYNLPLKQFNMLINILLKMFNFILPSLLQLIHNINSIVRHIISTGRVTISSYKFLLNH